jgi:hypothetical protein
MIVSGVPIRQNARVTSNHDTEDFERLGISSDVRDSARCTGGSPFRDRAAPEWVRRQT